MNSKKRNEQVSMPVNQSFHHDLSHVHATTLDYFRLQPVMLQECIGGSTYQFDLSALVSSAPLATQVYGGCHLDLHAFFVPFRILFNDWNNYYAGNTRSNSQGYTLPHITGAQLSSICGAQADGKTLNNDETFKELRRVFGSLGYPTFAGQSSPTVNYRYSILPARAYQQIWWDYYRDSVNIPENVKSSYLTASGGLQYNLTETFKPRYRTFKKDYVSTLLVSPQMGDAGHASVSYSTGSPVTAPNGTSFNVMRLLSDGSTYTPVVGNEGSLTSPNPNSVKSSISSSALRGALAMQRYLERMNITGTRPMERLLALLGAKPSPERLDMAELIGGKTIKLNVDGLVNSGSNEQVSSIDAPGYINAWGILNQSGDFGDHYGQGYQTGFAHGRGQSDKFTYHASENGYIIVIASIIPEYLNPNVVDRTFIRGLSTPNSDRFDFFHSDFDGLGYQEALLAEIATPSAYDVSFVDNSKWPTTWNPYNVVGYEPKYEDYRRMADRISGDFQEPQSATAMRHLAFTMSYPEIFDPEDVQAGLNLTTSSFAYREMFDKHFAISSADVDHFICYFSIVNDATLPVTGNQLPTELSDLANSTQLDISNGGVRL